MKSDFPVDRGSDEDQKRWVAELDAAMEAEKFPPCGSVIVTESPAQAQACVAELTANGHRAIARGIYVRTTLDFPRREEPAVLSMPSCTHCRLSFEEHSSLPDGDRACPGGETSFDCEFQVSDEAVEFVRANLDKTPEELTQLWIDRVRKRDLP